MKKNLFKRGMAGLLSLVMCLTALVGIGTTTAYAAGERAEVYLVSFPRSGDANIDYSGTWGHPNLRYMNGWHSGASKYERMDVLGEVKPERIPDWAKEKAAAFSRTIQGKDHER